MCLALISWRKIALMKALQSFSTGGRILLTVSMFWAGTAASFAQVLASNLIPVVVVQATQPVATPGQPGVFTVYRIGNPDMALNVWYDLGGTATNGVDYAPVPPHIVGIPAGAMSNTITITPLNVTPAGDAGGVQTVALTLTNSPLMPPVNYVIGSPSSAVVYVETGAATNLPPVVRIIAPQNGAIYYPPTNITLLAQASDPDGSVTNVEFFAGTNDLGPGAMVVLDPPGANGATGPVWLFNWIAPAPGSYSLTAVATDNGGAATTSAPVNIGVLPGPRTNAPPIVRMVSPPNGAVFHAPVNLPLLAFATDPGGEVASVEFFSGTNNLGFGWHLPVVTPLVGGGIVVGGPVPPVYPTNLYLLVWTNAPVGTDVLTAVATDVAGLSSTSAPVNITILPPVPPPTNRPPIMSIVATDPIAIEGTNSWVWAGETNATPNWVAWPPTVCRFFTNCGPKTATFTVRRFGDTNDNLTVAYRIGGTASNGVDYVALSGLVIVPAGERRAFITIVPIDDGPPDVNKTVILTLMPDTNTPPDYVIGYPARAAAIILDPGPCRTSGMLPDGCFHLTASGPDAAWFCVEYSTDLINWTPICTNQVVHGSIDFVDPDAAGSASRFYQAVPVLTTPQD